MSERGSRVLEETRVTNRTPVSAALSAACTEAGSRGEAGVQMEPSLVHVPIAPPCRGEMSPDPLKLLCFCVWPPGLIGCERELHLPPTAGTRLLECSAPPWRKPKDEIHLPGLSVQPRLQKSSPM